MAIDSRNSFVVSPLDLTTTSVSITGATLVSTTIAAAGASVRNIIKRFTLTCGASGAQAPLFAGIFDGGSTSSTVLALYCVMPTLTAASTGAQSLIYDMDNLHITASKNTITTVGTTAAPAASTSVGLTVQSYIFPKANTVTVTNPS